MSEPESHPIFDGVCWTGRCKNPAIYVYRVKHNDPNVLEDTYCQLCEECLKHYSFLDREFVTKII